MPIRDSVDRDRPSVLSLVLSAALWPAKARAQANDAGSKIPIGTIGAGHIGSTIGRLWVKDGHKVFFSSRHPDELKNLVANLGSMAQAGTVDQSIAFGGVVLISVPYGVLPEIGRDHAAALKGKIVLDTCNAVPARDGAIAQEVEANGIGVTSQKYLPGTRLVRAFNTMSSLQRRRTVPIRSSQFLSRGRRHGNVCNDRAGPNRFCDAAGLAEAPVWIVRL